MTMSAGGIRLESAPFFAMADAAMSAMDDAVSKPYESQQTSLSHAGHLYRIQITGPQGTSKRVFV